MGPGRKVKVVDPSVSLAGIGQGIAGSFSVRGTLCIVFIPLVGFVGVVPVIDSSGAFVANPIPSTKSFGSASSSVSEVASTGISMGRNPGVSVVVPPAYVDHG